jgi:hypothetical protein
MTSSHQAVPRRGAAGFLATRYTDTVYASVHGANRQSTRLDHDGLIYPVKHSCGTCFTADRWMMTWPGLFPSRHGTLA